MLHPRSTFPTLSHHAPLCNFSSVIRTRVRVPACDARLPAPWLGSRAMTPWHLEALATAAPAPFWLDRPDAPARRAEPGGRGRGRPADRRRRLHRAVGGDPGARGRPVARRRACSRATASAWGASGRNGGFLRGVDHARRGERAAAAGPRSSTTLHRLGAESYAGLTRDARPARHRLLVRGDRRDRRGARAARGRLAGRRRRRARPRSATRRSGSTATRCAPRSTRPRTSAGCG